MSDAASAPAPQPKAKPTLQGHASKFSDPEPWPEPVNGAALLDEVVTLFDRYVKLPRHGSTVLALWTLFTYVFEAARISPRLLITSPVMGCGKTTAMTLLASLVRRALPTSSITPPTLFREIEARLPTVLIDEIDSIAPETRRDLRNILNSGHTPAFAFVSRCAGDDHESRHFSTWAPIAYARIGRPRGKEATITDRSILIELQRATEAEKPLHLRQDRIYDDCANFRRRLARWAIDNIERIKTLDPDPPFINRAGDNWRPLIAIGDAIGGKWADRARAAAVALSGQANVQDDGDGDESIVLLLDVERVFGDARDPNRLASAAIVKALNERDDRRWADWNDGAGLNERDLAARLRGFRIKPLSMRDGDSRSVRGYYRTDFLDAWARYRGRDTTDTATAEQPRFVAESPLSRPVAPPVKVTATQKQTMKPASVAVLTAIDGGRVSSACGAPPLPTPTAAPAPTNDRFARWRRAHGMR